VTDYDIPEGVHEQMTIGKYTLYRHDYDGPYVITTWGEHGKGGDLVGIHAKDVEAAFDQLIADGKWSKP